MIDVAVFYTPAAREEEGGIDEVEMSIDRMVAETNAAYQASGVHQRINLVVVEEVVGYTQAVDTGLGESLTDLRRLLLPSDGHMDEVHDIRDMVAADIVLLVRVGYVSRAYQMITPSQDSASQAFCVVTTGHAVRSHTNWATSWVSAMTGIGPAAGDATPSRGFPTPLAT